MGTQKQRLAAPYRKFGLLLEQLRLAAGLAQQADLAKPLGIAQQSVSRWERGESRPRANQIAAIAKLLDAKASELMSAAGYSAKIASASFVQPFPVDSLSGQDFERFAHYFLSKRFPPPAKVHPAGGQGHAQEGVDLDVVFSDGAVYTFQCKRVEEFGPQKVHAAVAKHKRKAKRKFILLARVASPQARQAILEHAGWDLWDKEDISREVRDLSPDEQRRLVDIFFRGQRMALLGIDASSPWQTEEEFFAGYMNRRGAFNHTWELVGRGAELRALQGALAEPEVAVVNLEGAGGSGKTRVLKAAIEKFKDGNPATLVRLLSPTTEATQESLELGGDPKLLVVDDAHERSDLGILFQYAANPANKAKLLLSYRQYGANYIGRQAGRFALVGERASSVPLPRLGKDEVTALARQVLKERGGPEGAAEEIARQTLDCPLATVLGAHVVASERRHFELLTNEGTFRETLLKRFYDVAAGTIGEGGDREPIRKLLRALALLQPFNSEDPAVLLAIEATEGIAAHEVPRLVRILSEGGILFRRGGRFRISPDLLADHIIEQTCISHDGQSTGYCEKLFDAAGDAYLEHVLVNLGKLDWRRRDGDTSGSVLLNGLWEKLEPQHEYGDPHLKAITGAAFYQPERALDFVTKLVRRGEFLRELPAILKRVAYNLKHLERACELLWHIGKNDERQTNPHPEHAIRILKELCEVQPNKPAKFNEVVVDFGMGLLQEPGSWEHRYTPLDFLSGTLEVEGHTTSATSRTVTWSRYHVRQDFAGPLRAKVVGAVLRLLGGSHTKAAFRAARELGNAIRYGIGGADRNQWATEFANTLDKVLQLVKGERLEPVILLEIARSVAWHAQHGDGAPAERAKAILEALPDTLEFRTTLALVDGWGMLIRRMGGDFAADRKQLEEIQNTLAEDLLGAFGSTGELRRYLDGILGKIVAHDAERQSSPHIFLHVLLGKSPDLAEEVATSALGGEAGETGKHVHLALGVLLQRRRPLGLRIARQMLASPEVATRAAVGFAYATVRDTAERDADDRANLQSLLKSEDEHVVYSGIAALRSVRDYPLVIDLLKSGNISVSARVADDAMALLFSEKNELLEELAEDDIVTFLAQLKPLDELDGHWIEEFLAFASKAFANACADFFVERVEHAAKTENWNHRPCNHGPYGNVPLRFREASEFPRLLVRVSHWMSSYPEQSGLFRMRAGELFNAMFSSGGKEGRSDESAATFDGELVVFLRDWVERADEAGLEVIGQVLREGPRDLPFRERTLALRYLERCNQIGAKCYKSARGQLLAAALSGTRSGTPGEPFPEDIRLRDDATEALKSIPRFAPGRDFYEDLLSYAEHSIRQQLKESEAFEEE